MVLNSGCRPDRSKSRDTTHLDAGDDYPAQVVEMSVTANNTRGDTSL